LKEAQDNYRSALLLKPERAIAYSNLLFTMSYDPTYDAQTIFREHLEFSNRYSGPLSLIQRSHTNDRNPDRRLKIGYVSPDFRKHSVAFFIEPALSFHTREKYETFCYSDMLFPDTVTQRIQNHSDQWRNISGMSDEHVSEMILNDRIDILIDLAGHTGKNRMLMFSRKPAPVQVSWIGYPGTTGLSVMDYKIVDNYTDPEGMTEQFYTEKLLRMPESFLCYLPFQESPEIKPLPSLTKGSITFGSFNNFSKMSNETLDSWARLLNELSGSHLILKSQALTVKESRDRVIDIFKKENVSEDRIEFMSFVPSYQTHLDLYNRIDIALDTFPYNGTTTTCEALWMGVPVVTLAGNSHVSRVGVSLLSNAGIPELIAKDIDEYVSIASGLANDTERLIMLRHNLRQMISRSPLCNAKKFTNNLEHIYRTIWEDRCNMENTGETRG
jgi:predicted O-linked N-acetylglucosamine transferase (SPINDLY family)